MKNYYLILIILAGCTSPNKYSYYNDQWMYEKSYSQQVYESNKIANKNNRNNNFVMIIPEGDPDEVTPFFYEFKHYSGLTQADQDKVALSDAYCQTNGNGLKVGRLYNPFNN